VAEVVGQLLQSLSRHHQVLAVTHLPQVAVHARPQLRVPSSRRRAAPWRPSIRSNRGSAWPRSPRMLGGLKITETTRRHAEEMLQNARSTGTPVGKEKRKAAAGRS
jgi:DNA repair protein RecN (Recombination protein N)